MRSSLLKGNRTKAMAILLALTLTLMFAMPVMAADAQTGVIQTVIIEVDQNTLVEVNIADYAEACALKNALYNYLKGANEAPKVVALKGDNKRVDLLAYANNYAEQGKNVAAALAQSPELSADTLAKVNELISFNPETGVPELKPIVEPETKLVVESLSAINPTTIKVTFNNEVTAEAAAKANFKVSKGNLEAATKTGDKEVTLAVAGLNYEDVLTVTVVAPAKVAEVKVPKVSDIFTLDIITDAPDDTIKSDGATKTQITVILKDKTIGKIVDKDGIVQFQATDGGLGQTTSALIDGKATIQLTSVASATSITSILTATISDVPGAQEFKGLSAQKAIIFSPTPVEQGEIKFVTAVDAESTQGDRFFVTFSGNIKAADYKAEATKLSGSYGININARSVNIKDVVQATDNTLMFILDTDQATQTRIENPWAGPFANGNYLRDNVTHNVSFPNDIGNLVKANASGIDFILTDTSRPAVLGVTAKDQLEFNVRFTETVDSTTVIPVNFLIDGRGITLITPPTLVTAADVVAAKNANKIILTRLAAGVYDTNETPIDQRNIVNFKIYKDFALTPGLHQIQVANVGDWAQDVDPAQNIVATDTFDFNVIADVTVPVPTITVQSPEQWRVDFDKPVYGATGKKIKDVFAIKSTDTDDSFVMDTDYVVAAIDEKGDAGTALGSNESATKLNGERYFLIEFKEDWTVKYNTNANPLKTYFASTKNPYVVTIDNVESLVGNKMSKKDLNVTLSYDGVSPTIVNAEQVKTAGVLTDNVAVIMSEPIKNVFANVETLTPSQQQTAGAGVPQPTYEFVKGDQVVEAVAISESYDNYRFVLKPAGAKTLDAGTWTLYIRSISDDIGNTSATVSKELVIEGVTAKPTATQIAWAAFDDAAGTGKLINDDAVNNSDVIYVKFTKVMKADGADGVSRTQNYVFMGQPLPAGSQVLKGIKGVTNDWDGVTILMDKNTWNGVSGNDFTVALNIASNFKSADGELLSGRYEVELTDTSTANLGDGFEAIYNAKVDNTFTGKVVVKGADVTTSTSDGKIDSIKLTLDLQGAAALTGENILVNGKKFSYASIATNVVTFNAVGGNEITGTATNNLNVTTLNGSPIVNTGSVKDLAAPKIIKAELNAEKTKITVTFSEPVTKATGAAAGTFVELVKGDFTLTTETVTNVEHDETTPNKVILTVTGGAGITTVDTVTASGAFDFAGNASTAAATISGTIAATGITGSASQTTAGVAPSAGVTAVQGVDTITFGGTFAPADVITIDGEILTLSTGTTPTATATEVANLIEGNTTLNAKYTVVDDLAGVLTLTEKLGQEDPAVVTVATNSTTGTTVAASTTEGVTGVPSTPGTAEVNTLTISGPATAAGNITVTFDDGGTPVVKTIAVASGETAASIATRLQTEFAGNTTGWTVTASGDNVIFTANPIAADKTVTITVSNS